MRGRKQAERRPLAAVAAAVALSLAALLALAACAATAPPPVPARRELPPGPRLTTWPLEGEIHLSWEAIPKAASYTVYWSTDTDVAGERENPTPGLRGTTFVHKGLRNGRAYYYYVVALDAAGKEIHAFPPTGDIPFRYDVRRYRSFIAVVPRPHDTFESLAQQYLQDANQGWLIRDFNDLRAVTPFKAVLIPQKPYEPGGLTDKGYRTVPILTYHQITRTRPGRMAVLQTDIELQMAYLKRNRYQVITLEEFVNFLEFKGQVPERAVVITFDDGWASTYTIAQPILKKHGYKATLFVTTDLIGSNRKALTWQQVKAMEQEGVIDVQCHTRTHPNLADPAGRDAQAYLEFLKDEIVTSRERVQKRIGKTCSYLAYPYGATNHLVVALAQKAGYRAAFTVDRGANPFFVSNYRVLRSMVYGEHDLRQFAANLESFSDRVLQ